MKVTSTLRVTWPSAVTPVSTPHSTHSTHGLQADEVRPPPTEGPAFDHNPRWKSKTSIYQGAQGNLPRYVFHGSPVPPVKVFAEGLEAPHQLELGHVTDADLKRSLHDHALGQAAVEEAWRQGREYLGNLWVSTTKDPRIPPEFAFGKGGHDSPHVYMVDMQRLEQMLGIPVVDLNKALQRNPFEREEEVSVLHRVPPDAIVRAYPLTKDSFDFRPEVFGAPISNPRYGAPLPEGEAPPTIDHASGPMRPGPAEPEI